MINIESVSRYCKKYTKIENYELAMDPFFDNKKKWICHHRLETENSEGMRRLVDLTAKELQAFEMYYNRPPEELIFLTREKHSRIHRYNEINKKDPFLKFIRHSDLFMNVDENIASKILKVSLRRIKAMKKKFNKKFKVDKINYPNSVI